MDRIFFVFASIAVAILWGVTAFRFMELSSIGTKITVEDWECQAVSSRGIECQNIGRVCTIKRFESSNITDHYLGCGLDDWKERHPGESCPKDFGGDFECSKYLFQ